MGEGLTAGDGGATRGSGVAGQVNYDFFINKYICEHNSHLLFVLLVLMPRWNQNKDSRLYYPCRDGA